MPFFRRENWKLERSSKVGSVHTAKKWSLPVPKAYALGCCKHLELKLSMRCSDRGILEVHESGTDKVPGREFDAALRVWAGAEAMIWMSNMVE